GQVRRNGKGLSARVGSSTGVDVVELVCEGGGIFRQTFQQIGVLIFHDGAGHVPGVDEQGSANLAAGNPDDGTNTRFHVQRTVTEVGEAGVQFARVAGDRARGIRGAEGGRGGCGSGFYIIDVRGTGRIEPIDGLECRLGVIDAGIQYQLVVNAQFWVLLKLVHT